MPTPPPTLYVELLMSVDRVGTAARDAASREGEWPPQVVLAHLGDVDQQVWLPRMEQMVSAFDAGEPAPHFPMWEPDADETLARHATSTFDEALAHSTAARIALMARLRDLTPEQWSAPATHDVFGELDVLTLMYALLGHDEEHRASLLLG